MYSIAIEMVSFHINAAQQAKQQALALACQVSVVQAENHSTVTDQAQASRRSRKTLQACRDLAAAQDDRFTEEAVLLKPDNNEKSECEAHLEDFYKRKIGSVRSELAEANINGVNMAVTIRELEVKNTWLKNDVEDRDGKVKYWQKTAENFQEQNKLLQNKLLQKTVDKLIQDPIGTPSSLRSAPISEKRERDDK